MRKGDETKREMLKAAERLFCEKGYEETSVQDILDAVHGSKGGFYHHFVSKDDVLKQLCAARAEASCQAAEEALRGTVGPMARLNTVFRYALPLRVEETEFMGMLMPLLDRPESISVRVCYQDAITEAFQPLLARELRLAAQSKTVYPVTEEAAGPVLCLLNACWLRLALVLLAAAKKKQKAEPSALLEILTACRRCVEALTDAPFASVELLPLQKLDDFAVQILSEIRG